MKKITKITALVLTLALVLGMTSLAAVEITTSKSFKTYADRAAFTSDASLLSYTDGTNTYDVIKDKNSFTFGEGSFAYGKLYYQSAPENPYWAALTVADYNGITGVGTDRSAWHSGAQKPLQLAFTFPEAWEYNEDKALVVQMGIVPISTNPGQEYKGSLAGDYGTFGALMTTSSGNVIDRIAGNQISDQPATLGNFRLNSASQADTVNQNDGYGDTILAGTEGYVTTVIRPYDYYDESVTSAEDGSLDLISNINRGYGRNFRKTSNTHSNYHAVGAPAITKVHGLYYGFHNYQHWGLTGYRMFEVSLDPADFVITSEKSFENVAADNDITIEFSQPISTSTGYAVGVETEGKGGQLLELIKVTPAEGEALVYGEDYTIEVVEKSSGNSIWDALVISPVDSWAYGEEYTISIPDGIKNIARITMVDADEESANTDVITFTTEAAPTFDITLKAYKGLSDAGSEISALEAGTNYLKVTATYASGKVIANGKVRIEILDASGNVVKAVTTNRSLTDATSFGAAFKLEAGMTARAYIEGGVLGEGTVGIN